jgi:hypothetical protein
LLAPQHEVVLFPQVRPHPEEPCAAWRLEGWIHRCMCHPSRRAQGRAPQDEVRGKSPIQMSNSGEGMRSHSRGAIRPGLASIATLRKQRGRRESRVRAAPAISCAKMHKKAHTSIQVQRRQSGLPCAMVYGLLRALPGDRAFLPPSSLRSLLLKNLTPASGRQDHTASPSASRALVCRAPGVHRIPSQRS